MGGCSAVLTDCEDRTERPDLCGEEPDWWERGASGRDRSS
jgi:hypothetical protein